MRKTLLLSLFALACAGCNANILGTDERQILAQPAPSYTGSIPKPWYLYVDSVQSGDWFKGFAVWDNYLWVTLTLASPQQPHSGSACLKIRYDAAGGGSPSWAETAFIHTPDWSSYAGTPGRDLTAGGFTTCKFWMRSSANATVPVQMDGVGAQSFASTTSWQQFSFSLPVNQSAIKTFFQVNTPSVMPLDIYIDDLRYE